MTQPYELTPREWEVAQLALEGKTNKAIAYALHISESTVEFHLKNIYRKVEVGSRTELILKLGKSAVAESADVPQDRRRLNLAQWVIAAREAVSGIGRESTMENVAQGDARSANSLTFAQAIRVCLEKYADFTGLASRSEFWWFALFVLLVTSAFTYASEVAGSIFLIAVLLPLLAAGARRLREAGKSAWWLLFLLAPVGGLVVLVWFWALPPASAPPDDN